MQSPFPSFHVMAKPTGSVCNLNCEYCFYLEKEKLYPSHTPFKMSDETLLRYIQSLIDGQKTSNVITFAWQGGEPTLMGLAFYQRAVALQKQFAKGKRCENTFQTNGINLNKHWCEFFAKEGFLVGLSIDGDEQHHDIYRKTRQGNGTHHKVMQALQLLQQYQVPFNAMVVIHQGNVHDPKSVYRFLTAHHVQHIQFIPLVERLAHTNEPQNLHLIHPGESIPADLTPWSITAQQYGQFLNAVFDEWISGDIGKVFVLGFENLLGMAAGYPSNSCIHGETCGNAVVLEHNGDIYACDHYVYPEYKLGNIMHTDLPQILNQKKQIDFGMSKKNNLSVECRQCQYQALCHGGCPKHRFELSRNGRPNKNYFCTGYKAHFEHALPKLKVVYQGLCKGWDVDTLQKHLATLA